MGSVAGFWMRSHSRKKRLLASSRSSVRPFVRMHQCGYRWTYFREIWHWGLLRKFPETPNLVKIGQKVVQLGFFLAPRASNNNGHPQQKIWTLKNHIHWIYRYFYQYFKNFSAHQIIFLHLKYSFCCSLCCPLNCATRGGRTIPPTPQLCPRLLHQNLSTFYCCRQDQIAIKHSLRANWYPGYSDSQGIFLIKVLLLIKFVHMFDQKGLGNCTCYQFLGYCLVKGVKGGINLLSGYSR